MMSIHRNQSSNTKPLSLLVMCVLVFMLLLSQTMGQFHGVVHSSSVQTVYGQAYYGQAYGHSGIAPDGLATKPQVRSQASRVVIPKTWLGSLFSSHTGNADCRLYDQASHGIAVIRVAALILPEVLQSAATLVCQSKTPRGSYVALFDARGPPLMR